MFVRPLIVFTVGLLCAALSQAVPAQVPAAQMTLDLTRLTPGHAGLYGLMTEEINHSYDGGLYAELISNRTFRGNWMGVEQWGVVQRGSGQVTTTVDKSTGPSAALPTSLKIVASAAAPGSEVGVSNGGYWGIALQPGTAYRGSLYAKADVDAALPLHVQLINDDDGAVLASATVMLPATVKGWARYSYRLQTLTMSPGTRHHIEVTVAQPATLWLQLVSLMPPTFHDRPNGNRADLMQRMAAMHPHFLRLPGGNYLEGDTLADWYDWKKTIGPLVDRPGHQAPWSYWSSDGLGLLEFLEWCEDLKMEPVLAVYAGYSLRGQHVAPGAELEPYVQSALDEVEYVTGDVSTRWGAQRAEDGHPAPFPLHYVEVGNEDNFDRSGSYDARFAQFARALRRTHPELQLIATEPVTEAADAAPDVVDDHFYKSPAEMFALVHHYDEAPRSGPKVFVGEWATRSGSPTPNFGDALGDAAWMTAMERNSDLIVMASYAPLLVNVNPGAMQWATDLIGFDGLRSYGSPSYYAQSLFGADAGDAIAAMTVQGAGDRFFSSAMVSREAHLLHLRLVNASTVAQPLAISLNGAGAGVHVASITSLHAASFEATNSIDAPEFITPQKNTVRFKGESWQYSVPPLTIQTVDVPLP